MDALTTTAVELDADGAVVVVKRPTTAAAIERVEHEALVVDAARHPGVVDLAASVDADGAPALVTRWVGPHTLAGLTSLPLNQAAGIMAALADCVADLHALGVVHGTINAEHVILSPDGRPVLCGFGRSELVSTGEGSTHSAIADDVAALGHLLRTLTGGDVELEPIPEQRGWRRRPRWHGYQRRALLTLADQATSDEPLLRPTARAFAAAIHDCVPDARLSPVAAPHAIPNGVRSEPQDQPTDEPEQPVAEDAAGSSDGAGSPPDWRSPVHRTVRIAAGPLASKAEPASVERSGSRRQAATFLGVAGLVVTAAALVYGLAQLRSSARSALPASPATSTRSRTVSPSTVRSPTTSRRQPSTSRVTTPAPPRHCPSTVADGLDLNGDGCRDRVRVTNGIVQAGRVRYQVGSAGDQVVVGNWRCDGRATPAVLRPATGEVFVFSRWAGRGREVTIKPTTRIGGATALRATESDRDGCDDLEVTTNAGRRVRVRIGAAP